MLLERNKVNPEKVDKWSQKLLSWAIGSEHEGVVRMLLERTNQIPRHLANQQSTELFSVVPSGLPKPLPKRPSGFDIQR